MSSLPRDHVLPFEENGVRGSCHPCSIQLTVDDSGVVSPNKSLTGKSCSFINHSETQVRRLLCRVPFVDFRDGTTGSVVQCPGHSATPDFEWGRLPEHPDTLSDGRCLFGRGPSQDLWGGM